MRLSLLYETFQPSRRNVLKSMALMFGAALDPSTTGRIVKGALKAPVSLSHMMVYPQEWDPEGFHAMYKFADGTYGVGSEKSLSIIGRDGNPIGDSWRGGLADNAEAQPYVDVILRAMNNEEGSGALEAIWDEMSPEQADVYDKFNGYSPRLDAIRWEKKKREMDNGRDKKVDADKAKRYTPTDFELHDPYESRR